MSGYPARRCRGSRRWRQCWAGSLRCLCLRRLRRSPSTRSGSSGVRNASANVERRRDHVGNRWRSERFFIRLLIGSRSVSAMAPSISVNSRKVAARITSRRSSLYCARRRSRNSGLAYPEAGPVPCLAVRAEAVQSTEDIRRVNVAFVGFLTVGQSALQGQTSARAETHGRAPRRRPRAHRRTLTCWQAADVRMAGRIRASSWSSS